MCFEGGPFLCFGGGLFWCFGGGAKIEDLEISRTWIQNSVLQLCHTDRSFRPATIYGGRQKGRGLKSVSKLLYKRHLRFRYAAPQAILDFFGLDLPPYTVAIEQGGCSETLRS